MGTLRGFPAVRSPPDAFASLSDASADQGHAALRLGESRRATQRGDASSSSLSAATIWFFRLVRLGAVSRRPWRTVRRCRSRRRPLARGSGLAAGRRPDRPPCRSAVEACLWGERDVSSDRPGHCVRYLRGGLTGASPRALFFCRSGGVHHLPDRSYPLSQCTSILGSPRIYKEISHQTSRADRSSRRAPRFSVRVSTLPSPTSSHGEGMPLTSSPGPHLCRDRLRPVASAALRAQL